MILLGFRDRNRRWHILCAEEYCCQCAAYWAAAGRFAVVLGSQTAMCTNCSEGFACGFWATWFLLCEFCGAVCLSGVYIDMACD